MAQEKRINPDWVDAPYEMALLDKDGNRVVEWERIQNAFDGPERFVEADGKLVHVPKYIYVPT